MPERIGQDVASALCAHADSIRLSPRSPLEVQSNRLYDAWIDGRHLIVKEYLKPDEFADAPRREYGALQRLAAMDIAPQPVAYWPDASPAHGPFVIYEYLEGQMWDRRHPSPSELSQLVELWLTINSLPTNRLWLSRGTERTTGEIAAELRASLKVYSDWAERNFPDGQEAAALCLSLLDRHRWALDAIDAAEPVLRFCRSDHRFANIIRRPDGRLAMVDWEDCGLRDPARDLIDLTTHVNQEDLLSADEWRSFLEPYLAVQQQNDPDLPHRYHLYLALAPIWWLVILLSEGLRRAEAGQLAGWRIHDLAPNHRFRRYLARALAWPDLAFDDQLEELEEVRFFPE